VHHRDHLAHFGCRLDQWSLAEENSLGTGWGKAGAAMGQVVLLNLVGGVALLLWGLHMVAASCVHSARISGAT